MQLIDNFLASFPFAETTKNTYRRVLSRLILIGDDLAALSAADLIEFVSVPEWGSSQRYVALCACRRFLAWRFESHPALSARLKQVKPKKQRVLTASKALELLASFDTSTAGGARDLAICALALDTGLRCSELCRLRLPDVDLPARTLQVVIKGGQWGMGIFSEQTALYIGDWLAFRLAAPGVETLFVSLHHRYKGKALSCAGLQQIVEKWGERLGIPLSPHDLRRSFATLATVFGAPSRVVQQAGRWSDIGMVERYTVGLDMSAIIPYLPVARLVK